MNSWLMRGCVLAAAVATLSAAVVAQSQSVPKEWKSLDGQGLAELSEELAGRGEAGKQARSQLVGLMTSKHLRDAEAVRQVTCAQWKQLAENLRSDMTHEVRGARRAEAPPASTRN